MNSKGAPLTQAVPSVVTMATLGLPDFEGADGSAARVFTDEHGGKVTLLNLLNTK